MSQCFLTGCNGLLSLRKPQRDPCPLCSPADYEWAGTDLDEICVEELLEESALLHNQDPPLVPRVQHGAWRATCPSTFQYQLSSKDGVVVLRYPQCQLRPRRRLHEPIQTSTAAWHTTSCSKPWGSILMLPAELRLPIYRHLLVSCCDHIHYPICPSTDGLRLVARNGRYSIHKLYPEILATCRLINREGTPIPYEENVFHREFYWPHKWHHASNKLCPWPLLDSYRLNSRKIQLLSRIRVFRQYHRWLSGDGELKVFQDFPSLKELQIDIDLNDPTNGLHLKALWQDAMKSASRKQPKLARVKCWIRLAYDHDCYAWLDRCRSRPLDFSLHKVKRRQFEKWMEDEKLFPGRQSAWSFETMTSEYGAPCCSVEFVIDDTHNADRSFGIPCRILGDYGDHFSIEPS